jgi:hypothetical protein
MNVITTREVQDMTANHEPLNINQPQTVSFVEGRDIGMSDTVIALSPEHREQIEHLASRAMQAFGIDEPTLVATRHGVPTLLARVDCTITPQGVGLFECDERPAGIGVTDRVLQHMNGEGIAPRLDAHFTKHIGQLPTVLRHPNAKPNDDGLVLRVDDLDGDVADQPILARGEPDDMREHIVLPTLQARSVSTLVTKGIKRYLLAMPEARSRQITSPDELSPDTSFVLKPLQGSKAQNVHVYLSTTDRAIHGRQGTVTFERARRELAAAAAGSMLVQEFIPPIPTTMPDDSKGNTILRVFTLVHPDGRCEAIGGTYVSRRELVVHGASNAICGAVVL